MNYSELTDRLHRRGFYRVERDDRLLDVFADQTREKGYELWEHWHKDKIVIFQIHEPPLCLGIAVFVLPRADLEQALEDNRQLELAAYSQPLEPIEYLASKDNVA